MKNILKIREVRQLPKNSDFNVIGAVSKFTRRTDRNNNPFWEITLSDSTGDIDGKVWSASVWWNTQGGDKFLIDPDNCGLKFEGSALEIEGRIAEYREQIQYNFNTVYFLDQNEFPPYNFTRHSPLRMDFLEAEFKNLIAEISNESLKNFVHSVFFKHNLWEKFRIWPAAVSLHHAYTGGLLEHSVSVAKGAKDIAKHYVDFKIPVNLDIVVAGALLHDIGKIEAYTPAPVPQMTIKGNIIDHVALGYSMFKKFAELENLDENISLAIGHVMISHHGRHEYGAVVLPENPEAMIVSAADDLDFKLSYWKLQIEALNNQSEITDYLPLIDRRLWRGIDLK